jgi:hypothetical protein
MAALTHRFFAGAMQSGGEARYNSVKRVLTPECDCPGPRRNQALRRDLRVNSFRVEPDSVFATADAALFSSTDCLFACYISGRASCRLGSGGH